jgi:hypothetical protein
MTSPKKAEWFQKYEEILWSTEFELCDRQIEFIDNIISQTHTELCTTLKERVEKLQENLPERRFNPEFNVGYCSALDDTITLIDSLLVTDESEGFKHANETIKNGYIGEFAGFEKDESPVFNKDLNK